MKGRVEKVRQKQSRVALAVPVPVAVVVCGRRNIW